MGLPGSEVLLHDVPADAVRFKRLIEEAKGRAFVLYPSADAVPAAEAVARSDSESGAGCGGPFLAVLVDGTWKQALRMHRALEGLPHVALEATNMQSEFHWRRQSQEGRISTV